MPRTSYLPPRVHFGWVLIANSARARSFVRDEENHAMREICSFVHTESRQKGLALQTDRAGKIRKSEGASSQFSPVSDPHRKEHTQFARELAQYLEEAALAHRFSEVSLIASKAFLGELRLQLGPATRQLLHCCIASDLTAYESSDLERRVTQALQNSSSMA
ncbi:MAG: host attachment protein [Burkholderiales bacterium]